MFTLNHVPEHCSNVECPNRSHEGLFTLVQGDPNCVGEKRGLSIWLCSPCAAALVQSAKEGGR